MWEEWKQCHGRNPWLRSQTDILPPQAPRGHRTRDRWWLRGHIRTRPHNSFYTAFCMLMDKFCDVLARKVLFSETSFGLVPRKLILRLRLGHSLRDQYVCVSCIYLCSVLFLLLNISSKFWGFVQHCITVYISLWPMVWNMEPDIKLEN